MKKHSEFHRAPTYGSCIVHRPSEAVVPLPSVTPAKGHYIPVTQIPIDAQKDTTGVSFPVWIRFVY